MPAPQQLLKECQLLAAEVCRTRKVIHGDVLLRAALLQVRRNRLVVWQVPSERGRASENEDVGLPGARRPRRLILRDPKARRIDIDKTSAEGPFAEAGPGLIFELVVLARRFLQQCVNVFLAPAGVCRLQLVEIEVLSEIQRRVRHRTMPEAQDYVEPQIDE